MTLPDLVQVSGGIHSTTLPETPCQLLVQVSGGIDSTTLPDLVQVSGGIHSTTLVVTLFFFILQCMSSNRKIPSMHLRQK